MVFVALRWEDRDTVAVFEQAVAAVPHVVQAQRLFGEPDYLLRIVTADLAVFNSCTTGSWTPCPASSA